MAQIRVTTRKTTIVAEKSNDSSATIVFTLTSPQDPKKTEAEVSFIIREYAYFPGQVS